MIPDALIEAHRRDLAELFRLAVIDLGVAFSSDDGVAVRNRLMRLLPELAEVYGAAAATLAADWMEEARDAAAIPGRARAVVADLPDRGRTNALARWAVGPLFQAKPDLAAARSQATGGFQRIVYDADRQTILRSIEADPRGAGWSRRTSGSGCEFCQMLAGRGAVYKAGTADFKSHDHCNCIPVPVYDVDLTDAIDLRETADLASA